LCFVVVVHIGISIFKNRQDACSTKSQLFVGSRGWAEDAAHKLQISS
jgi:hypothetical protein